MLPRAVPQLPLPLRHEPLEVFFHGPRRARVFHRSAFDTDIDGFELGVYESDGFASVRAGPD